MGALMTVNIHRIFVACGLPASQKRSPVANVLRPAAELEGADDFCRGNLTIIKAGLARNLQFSL